MNETSLVRLAELAGIGVRFTDANGEEKTRDDQVLRSILAALGIDASNDEATESSIERLMQERYGRLIAPTVLHIAGKSDTIVVNTGILEYPRATLILEDGTTYQHELAITPMKDAVAVPCNGTFVASSQITIPADVPIGYHTLRVTVGEREEQATLISAPERIKTLDNLKNHSKLWGWMVQLYSVRSSASWGVGDYADLADLLVKAKDKTGADFVLINPVHAGEPVAPLTPSPYLPAARNMVNITYIRPESIPEYAELDDEVRQQIEELHGQVEPLNHDAQIIDRDAMWRVKMRALWIIFKAGLHRDDRVKAFEAFKQEQGDALESYALWCLCYDKWGAPNGQDTWEVKLTKDDPAVNDLKHEFPDTLEFYRWLEWVAVEQLTMAQVAARRAGMRIGIMADMAVGVHPSGSEVWWDADRFVRQVSVGAPPDYFNQQGQNWSQPPLNPFALRNSGYRAYRAMVHGMFAAAGAVRIDHILGLFRLWWIPQGVGADCGAYVYYDHRIMLGILAIEATRAGGVVVGEDLGVVPANAVEALANAGVLGCAVEWFEQCDGKFRKPQEWREMALASVDTHDMPPAAGYLAYEHVDIRERLHLLSGPVEEFRAGAVKEHQAMLDMLVENCYLDESVAQRDLHADSQHDVACEQEIVEALHRALKAAPSRLLAASLVDAVGERRSQNQPGTNNEYPNWRIPLADGEGNPVLLDTLFDMPRVQSLAAIMNE